MARPRTSGYDMAGLEELARAHSPVHRVDPRVKLVTLVFFTVCVVSFDKYELSRLAPYTLFFAVVLPVSGIPVGAVIRRVAAVLPLAVIMGLVNPIYDRTAVCTIAGVTVTGGLISFASIVARFSLTVGAAVMIVAATGFTRLCAAMDRLGLPAVLTTQLLLVYRYTSTLTTESSRMILASDLRASGSRKGMRTASGMLGNLLFRTWERGRRIHMAMLSRAWDGKPFHRLESHLRASDVVFGVAWCAAFTLFRIVDISGLAGALAARIVA
ncbi:MAG TPA: cobalt ECF transporter T component CbiQ [Deltaproteobacteria bacterium]|nr:cobalt ECF transporter T component CbiQ [Deltaproteobacteria bacterium]